MPRTTLSRAKRTLAVLALAGAATAFGAASASAGEHTHGPAVFTHVKPQDDHSGFTTGTDDDHVGFTTGTNDDHVG